MQKHNCLAQKSVCDLRGSLGIVMSGSAARAPARPKPRVPSPPPFHPRLSRSLRACLAFSVNARARRSKERQNSQTMPIPVFFVMFGTVCDQGPISAQRRGILEGLSSPHRSSRDIFHFRSSAALGPLPSAATHSRTVHTRLQSLTSDIVYPRLSPSLALFFPLPRSGETAEGDHYGFSKRASGRAMRWRRRKVIGLICGCV